MGERPNLLNTAVFKLTLIYMIIFGGFASLIVVFFYYSTVTFMARQTDQTIQAEVVGLAEANRGMGSRQGLLDIVTRRSEELSDSLYLLASEDRTRIAGNLVAWPEGQLDDGAWITFPYERQTRDGVETRQARARIFQLTSGDMLVVGRDIEQRLDIESTLTFALFTAIGFILLVGGGGGVVLSRSVLHRIDRINRTSRDIMAGDLSRRVPVQGEDDELDQLADNLNAMLEQIERLMTGMKEVTDNVAHDLRSPLTRLRNRLEVALMSQGEEDEYRAAIEKSIQDADHLLATFNALLSIAQLEAGASRDSMGPVAAGDVVRDIAELYEPVAESKDVSFDLNAEGQGVVWGNRELLSQAMANLMDNAIKYTPGGGAVTVRLHLPDAEDPMVRVSVCDSGPGIPESDRTRVLKRFVRLEASRNTPGSGLGLSLVSAVARMHDGALSLGDSDLAPGKGRTAPGLKATIHLPHKPL